MDHWSYDLLKNIAVNDRAAQENLGDLKSIFRDEIGSARNMSRIKTIEDLIEILERHDSLSEQNIEPLREVADLFEIRALEKALSSYVTPKDSTAYDDPYNQYKEQRLADEFQNHLKISEQVSSNKTACTENGYTNCCDTPRQQPPASPSHLHPLTEKKKSAIYKLIAENIGKFWRAFGRELELRQGQLDNMESQHPRDLVSRVHQMLQLFEEDESHDHKKHVLIICRALEECRRKDLRRKVEDIMSH